MQTALALAVSSPSPERTVSRVAVVAPRVELDAVPLAGARWPDVLVDRVAAEAFDDYLDGLGGESLAVALVLADPGDPGAVRILRMRPERARTRAYVLAREGPRILMPAEDDLDIEGIAELDRLTPEALSQVIDNGLRAYRALGVNPLIPEYYLDATYNRIFDWFETTKWDWREVDLSQIRRELLTEPEIEILQESAIIEFGTLPGAHNFLREWADEYGFSSWALSWGAEEARHSLVQCRYLHEIGIEVRAKHAMYKREPYPMGENRAATLMMNIISESRAAEYYKTLARCTREPVLRKMWRLLGRDESRHARAFFVFCKELVDAAEENAVAAVQMAYVWLADRRRGVKHPAGFFYPHSSSTSGLRRIEDYAPAMTDIADRKVLAMIRNLLGNESARSVGDLKTYLRSKVA
jgi:hypothetical protein